MAGRSIHELEQLSLYTGRFHMGSIRDFGPSGNNGVWGASVPELRRGPGQTIGLLYENTGDVVTVPNIDLDGTFTFEVVFLNLPGDVDAASQRPISHGTAAATRRDVYVNTANYPVTFDCGAALNSPNGTVDPNVPTHLICTRDDSDDGVIYKDGVSVAAGAVGGDDADSTLYIGNRDTLDRTWHGFIYLVRVLSDDIDADEAARLFEHSRLQLWPGSPKRSGIWSPVV